MSTEIKNVGSSDLSIDPLNFKLYAADMNEYGIASEIKYEIPGILEPGASTMVTMGFEVANGTTPTKLVFENSSDAASIEI